MADAKNSRRSTLILNCFKPIVDDDYGPGGDEAAAVMTRKKRLRRGLSAALKAVLFKTALLKKSRSENCKQNGSRSNLFSQSLKLVNSMKKNLSWKPGLGPEQISRTNSDRSSIFSSNSSSSSTPSLSFSSSPSSSCSSLSTFGSDKMTRSLSLDFRQMDQHQKTMKKKDSCGGKSLCNYDKNLTLEMRIVFLVCLGALVWGKAFAIVVCTSTWLFFAPASHRHRSQHRQRLRRSDSFNSADSEEYKKRVIVIGWLERNP